MKIFLLTILAGVLVCTAQAQTAGTYQSPLPAAKISDEDRMFLPKGWIFGYVQLDIAPPHNEPDPNLCAADAGKFGGKNSLCNAFARYLIGGNVIIHPFGRTLLRRLRFEATPTFAFGKNVPQYLYTWSWQPIGWERSWSAAVELPYRFDVRVTQHFLMQRLGSRDQYLGPAYLGPNGPWGRYTTIGVRKTFGTYREFN